MTLKTIETNYMYIDLVKNADNILDIYRNQ